MADGAILPLCQVALGNAAADIYAPPTGAQQTFLGEFTALWIANTDTDIRLVTLLFGPTGALASIPNALGDSWAVPAKTTFMIDATEYNIVVPFGYHLQGLCDIANKVVVTGFGMQRI